MNYDLSKINYGRGAIAVRLVFTLVLVSVVMTIFPIATILVVVELIMALATGTRPPLVMMRITDRLVCYLYQVTDYLIMKESQLPFPFQPLPPPSDQFASAPVEHFSNSDYADAEDVTITNAPTRQTAPVCSLADSEDVTVSNQVGYQPSNVPVAIESEKSDQAVNDDPGSTPELSNSGDAQLEEVTAEELDETVLSMGQNEAESNKESNVENEAESNTESTVENEVTAEAEDEEGSEAENESDDGVSADETEVTKVPAT